MANNSNGIKLYATVCDINGHQLCSFDIEMKTQKTVCVSDVLPKNQQKRIGAWRQISDISKSRRDILYLQT